MHWYRESLLQAANAKSAMIKIPKRFIGGSTRPVGAYSPPWIGLKTEQFH
jgi:hypothetical protein